MSVTPMAIGFPVYNGEGTLELALSALLAQTFGDFDLIISDNASTDGTQEICQAFASRDRRIRLVRQLENRGASWNFTFVLHEARSPLFMWAAHDDLWDPRYISLCREALLEQPSALLSCSELAFIDSKGEPLGGWCSTFRNLNTVGMGAIERVRQLFRRTAWFAIYGVGYRETFLGLGMDQKVYGVDVLALMRVLLQGDIVCVPESLMSLRIAKTKTAAEYQEELDPGNRDDVEGRPYTNLMVSLVKTLFSSEWPSLDKEEAFLEIIRTVVDENRYWADIILAECGVPGVDMGRNARVRYLCGLLAPHLPADRLGLRARLRKERASLRVGYDLRFRLGALRRGRWQGFRQGQK